MKVFNITAIPLASVFFLVAGMLATRDITPTKVAAPFDYSVSWGSRSFDEAIWLAVDEMARLDENLPPEIQRFHVALESAGELMPTVYLDFDRVYLAQLKAGEISPEMFIREHVDFN